MISYHGIKGVLTVFDAKTILTINIGVIAAEIVILFLHGCWCVRRERRRTKSLKRDKLLQLENQLNTCLEKAGLHRDKRLSVEEMIKNRGFSIQEVWFIPAYTTKKPADRICVWKFLPKERKNIALAHELMRILYKPEKLDHHTTGWDIHSLFKSRSVDEQVRDYMAAALILPKDEFWEELMDVDYINADPETRKQFVYAAAARYDVETPVIFRRISELRVLMAD